MGQTNDKDFRTQTERAARIFSMYDNPWSAQKQCEQEGLEASAIMFGETLFRNREIERGPVGLPSSKPVDLAPAPEPKVFTAREASDICRVLAAIELTAWQVYHEERNTKDGLAMYRILGALQYQIFGYTVRELGA